MNPDHPTRAADQKRPPSQVVRAFLGAEATGGAFLVAAVAIAILWANLGGGYFEFWDSSTPASILGLKLPSDLQHWVNDGLMVIFFFLVSLEIKREMVVGELSDRRAAVLPVLAATGGALLPALIYLSITGSGGEIGRGWGIPMATDIAFVVGVLALLGNRVPVGAKILLLGIAIVDDVIAIVVIAVFYTAELHALWLAVAALLLLLMFAMRRVGVNRPLYFVPVGILIWFAMLQSGVHPTIAGVAIGLLTPAGVIRDRDLIGHLEHRIHPWSSLLIVPLFALANAGIAFNGEVLSMTTESSLALAIMIALVAGKLTGIAGTTYVATRIGIARLPTGVSWPQVTGIAALAGIGFTVSLFIAQLSFTDPELVEVAKIGIFAGSLISAALGIVVLLVSTRGRIAPDSR